MSLAISTTTAEGIILAAESRQSFRNKKGIVRIGSDTASKVFQISSNIGIAVTGIAFLPENGVRKSIGYFVEQFKEQYQKEIKLWKVEEIANQLSVFLEKRYDYKSSQKSVGNQITDQIKQNGFTSLDFKPWKGQILEFTFLDKEGKLGGGTATIDTITFIIAGFDKDKKQKVFIVNVPGNVQAKRDGNIKGKEFGADWIGQIDIATRIVLGFDPRVESLPFVRENLQKNSSETLQQLRGLEYVIHWGTMTLQDGVDFSTLIIKTTEAMQKFSDGIAMNPGDAPGVGGEIDIALITAKDGFNWLKQKEIRYKE